MHIEYGTGIQCRSQWLRGLRRRSETARLLRSWVRIQPGAWMFVCCECCVLSGRGLCDELITRPKESHRLWCVVVCELETSRMRRPWPALGRSATKIRNIAHTHVYMPDMNHVIMLKARNTGINWNCEFSFHITEVEVICTEVENSSQKCKHSYTNNIGLVLEEQIRGKGEEALNPAHVFF